MEGGILYIEKGEWNVAVKFTQLQCKEVICVKDGCRLGCVSDVVVEVPEGKVCSLIVAGSGKWLGVVPGEEYEIPWQCICRIGPDIILVDVKAEECRVKHGKKGLWLGK